MAATDPDFLSLVDTNRFQPVSKDLTSPKARAKNLERKKAYWNEVICLRLVSPSESTSGTWNIPRFRLTETFLHDAVNRGRGPSSPTLLVSHLHDPSSNAVILPDDNIQAQCMASPVVYDIVVYFAGAIKRGGVLSGSGDSYYSGDLLFVIHGIPRLSKSGMYEVTPGDVQRWLVNGAISSLETVQVMSEKIKKIKETLQQLEKDIKNVHVNPIYNDGGRAIVGSPLKVAREAKFKFLQEEREQTINRLGKAVQSLDSEQARHFAACSLRITERNANGLDKNDNGKTIAFEVKVMGKKKDKEFYTNLITEKNDWSLRPILATGEKTPSRGKNHKSKSNKGNENATDVSIVDANRTNQHFVDMGEVSITMLPDGFGVHEAFDEIDPFVTSPNSDNDNARRSRHRMYHGHFRDGEYHEGTLHTGTGVYSGLFLSNEPCKGKMKYADGVLLEGDFSLPPERVERVDGFRGSSPLGSNPYLRGLPHGGSLSIQFKDGSSYMGEMMHGDITGHGIYKHPNVVTGRSKSKKMHDGDVSYHEIKGDFEKGMLQNNDGIEGQGYSNLLQSLLCGGKRLWGLCHAEAQKQH